jgi:uncharacterized membrane protein
MRGNVIGFDPDANAGAISGHDGNRYGVKTHYRFQIRTFWIGLLYGFLSWIGFLYGFLSLLTAIIIVGLFFGVFTLVWWIVRCVKGLKLLAQGAACENPATWLW